MKINKRLIRKSALTAAVTVLIGVATSCTDIWSEQHPGTFYISDGKTVATFLEEYPENEFSSFIQILKQASYWAELKTYGDRTLFAPTNGAIDEYLEERYNEAKDRFKPYFKDIDSFIQGAKENDTIQDIIDTIAKTHLCKESIYLNDLREINDGTLPYANMMGRYLNYEAVEDSTDPTQIRVAFMINQFSKIIEPDDSTSNGVIQIIDKVIRQSTLYLPGYLKDNNTKARAGHKATIFEKAIKETGLDSLLNLYRDGTYPKPKYDSTFASLEFTGKAAYEFSTGYQNFEDKTQQRVVWPEERLLKYTLFVVSDSVLAANYGINNYDDFVAKAKEVYPEGALLEDDNTGSSLYKLVSYHILPCWLERKFLNYSNPKIVDHYKNACPDSIDMEDFYESVHPYAIMRISTPYDKNSGYNGKEIFINRKGTATAGNLENPGVRIWKTSEVPEINTTGALNGGYYYVDSLLLFNKYTRDILYTSRLRFMGATLSPDFINSNARGRVRQDNTDTKAPTVFACYAYKEGYCKNFSASDQTLFVVRYLDTEWDIMYHDELNIKGIFDLKFKLPPVPKNGTYEIRTFGNAQSNEKYRKTRGIVQFYLGEEDANGEIVWSPCGIPVNMAIMTNEPKVGCVLDKDQTGTDEEKEEKIKANDKAMRNRGFMKGPAGFAMGSKVSDRLRNHDVCFRKIITATSLDAGKNYYLRMRQVKEEPGCIAPLNFIEIVSKSVYEGLIPEDRY